MKVSKFKSLIAARKQGTPTLAEVDEAIAKYEQDPDTYLKLNPTPGRDGVPRYTNGTPIFTGDFIFPGVCMSDISRDTGITVGGVSRIFNGDRKAKLYTLKSIANLYTNGSVDEVRAIIRKRVLRRVREDSQFRHIMTLEHREKLLRNAGVEVVGV